MSGDSTPLIRQGVSAKRTMASAERDGLNTLCADEDLSRPVMPHLVLSGSELDELYPTISAPGEVDNPDVDGDDRDTVLQHGLIIAATIQDTMDQLGRSRRHGRVRQPEAA